MVTRNKFLLAEGRLRNQDNVIHVGATRPTALSYHTLEIPSHGFHWVMQNHIH
jgi:hypothetical protein